MSEAADAVDVADVAPAPVAPIAQDPAVENGAPDLVLDPAGQAAAVEVGVAVPALAHAPSSRKLKRDADETSKEAVRSKLKDGSYVVEEAARQGSSSSAWQKFGRVIDSLSRETLDFVQCRECGLIKIHKKNSATSGLVSHKCLPPPTLKPRPAPTTEDLVAFRESLVDLCSGELLPFSLVDSPLFRAAMREGMKLGDKFGEVAAAAAVPSSKTLTQATKAKADTVRTTLVQEIKEVAEDGLVSATVDAWTDNQRGRKYLAHTVSHIDEDFVMHDNLLFIPHCDAESVTATVLREEIDSNLASMDLPQSGKFHYVTDDGADIVCALKDNQRSYCMDHCTNLLVKKALQPTLTSLDLFGDVGGRIVDRVSEAVDAIKSSRVHALRHLKGNLKKGPRTRLQQRAFQSSMPMLQSVKRNFTQVKDALRTLKKSSVLEGIREKDVADVVSVIHPVELLARKKKNCFDSSHFDALRKLTSGNQRDSQLQSTLRAHIREEVSLIVAILAVIKKCKDIVTYIKTSGLNETIVGGSLKQENETRWMSLLELLRSFFPGAKSDLELLSKINQINEIFRQRARADLILSDDDVNTMRALIPILTSFEKAIKKFEGEKEPTIQHVLPQLQELRSVVAADRNDSDSEVIRKFRVNLAYQLEHKFASNVTERHKLGLFLWPKFKSLGMLSNEDRREVLAAARNLIKKQEACLAARKQEGVEAEVAGAGPPSKRMRLQSVSDSEDEYGDFCDEPALLLDEVDRYCALPVDMVKSKQLLSWWKRMAPQFPVLSRVARMVLATPASSAPSERRFSDAGRLITSRRNCLSPGVVNDVMIVLDYLKKKLRASAH